MESLREAIAGLLAGPEDLVLARSILGTTDVDAIAGCIETHVRAELARDVVGCELFTQSVGAVFLLVLDDGQRVVLKAHAFAVASLRGFASLAEIDAVYAAQAELAANGFPCARVLRRPTPFACGAAALMSVLEAPRVPDPHDRAVRQAMARELARTVELGRVLTMRDRLPRAELPATLFPPPHNALFDFSRPGGEWIDARARAARNVLDANRGAPVIMHSDFSCANVRTIDARIVAVYDMDSVCAIDEMRCLASTAVHFTYNGDPPWTLPSRDEARAFVDDYVAARERPLGADERARLDAGAIYAMAYTARCEYGHGAATGQMLELLRDGPDAYF